MMHAAKLASSTRLQRVVALLSDGGEHSTRDILIGAEVMAVSAIVAELRANGAVIHCRQARSIRGERIWLYRLEAI